jgi:hypothetical protein
MADEIIRLGVALEGAHAEEGATWELPGFRLLLENTAWISLQVNFLAADNEIFELRKGFAEENAAPGRAVLVNILQVVAKKEITFATSAGSTEEELRNPLRRYRFRLGAGLWMPTSVEDFQIR